MLRHTVGLLGVAVGLCGCPDPNSIPEDDRCSAPNSEGIASLTIGRGDLTELFVPLQDSDVIPMVIGGQGTDMLELRYLAKGVGLGCVDRSIATRVPNGGPVVQSRGGPLRLYSQGGDRFLSESDYTASRAPRGALLDIAVSMGTQTHVVTAWLGSEYSGPALLPPETSRLTVAVGETFELELRLSEASENLSRLTSVLEAEPGIVETGLGFGDEIYIERGSQSTTVDIRGIATGVATYTVGLGSQYYAIEIEVVEAGL